MRLNPFEIIEFNVPSKDNINIRIRFIVKSRVSDGFINICIIGFTYGLHEVYIQ